MKDKSKYLVIGAIFLVISTAIFSFAIPYYDDKISIKEHEISILLDFYQIKNTIYVTAGKSIKAEERILKEINPKSEYISETSEDALRLKRTELLAIYPAAYGVNPSPEIQNKWGGITNISELDKEINKVWTVLDSNNSYAFTTLKELDNLKSYKSRLRIVGVIFQITGLILVTTIPNLLDDNYPSEKSKIKK